MESLFSKKFAMATASSLVLAPSEMLYNSTLAQGSEVPPSVIIWSGWTLTVTFYKNTCQSWCMHPTLYSIIYHVYFHYLLSKNYFIWRYFHSANLDDLRMAYIACTLKYIFTYCQKCTYILVFSQLMNNCPQQLDNQENSFQEKGLCIALNNLLSHHFSLYICLTKKIVSDMIVNITRSEKQF